MAKVAINATAHIKEGLLIQDDIRSAVLEVLGKNGSLLKDTQALFNAGLLDKIARVKTIDGVKYAVVLENKVKLGAVVVKLLDFTTGELKGSVIYGKTKFFSCLDEE